MKRDITKYLDRFFWTLIFFGLCGAAGSMIKLHADTGWEGATRKEIGSYGGTRVVSASSATPGALWSSSVKRPDGVCRINALGGGSEVWVGTTSAESLTSVDNENIRIGFPMLSSETLSLGGSYTGAWYFNCSRDVSSCEMRCMDGLVR